MLLWKAVEQAGIYAIAEVIEPAQHLTEEVELCQLMSSESWLRSFLLKIILPSNRRLSSDPSAIVSRIGKRSL
ncbi:MAG: hypothetical protein ACOC1Z_06755 [Cyanobacteriota bacterium]